MIPHECHASAILNAPRRVLSIQMLGWRVLVNPGREHEIKWQLFVVCAKYHENQLCRSNDAYTHIELEVAFEACLNC